MDPHKVQTIMDWAIIAFVCDVQCFLRFVNFYQHFIAGYSMIMTPSTCLGFEVEIAFQFLKASFHSSDIRNTSIF
jgi:hypothetical protein